MDTPIAYLETTLTLDDGRRVRRFRQVDQAQAEREARELHEREPETTIRVWGEPGRCSLKLGPEEAG